MFNNKALNKKIKNLLKDLKKKDGISLYRVAKETSIPHSSLKYMLDNRFEWKLNHLYGLITFLKKYRRNISIDSLLREENGLDNGNANYDLNQIYLTSPRDLNTFTIAPDMRVEYRFFSKEVVSKSKKNNSKGLSSTEKYEDSKREMVEDICRILRRYPAINGNKVSINIKITKQDGASPEEIKITFDYDDEKTAD